jgi:hypothetical protein
VDWTVEVRNKLWWREFATFLYTSNKRLENHFARGAVFCVAIHKRRHAFWSDDDERAEKTERGERFVGRDRE